jgi:hypothetical protein
VTCAVSDTIASAGSAIVGVGEAVGPDAAPEEDALDELDGEPGPGWQPVSASAGMATRAATQAIRRPRLDAGRTDMAAPFIRWNLISEAAPV